MQNDALKFEASGGFKGLFSFREFSNLHRAISILFGFVIKIFLPFTGNGMVTVTLNQCLRKFPVYFKLCSS